MSVAACASGNNFNIAQIPLHLPHHLHALLSTVKEVNKNSTLEEVLEAMKDYIYKHTLYDLTDPRVIHCENNELGKMLGVNKFTFPELKRIILKFILKENVETVRDLQKMLAAAIRKRKSNEVPVDGASAKKFCSESLGSSFDFSKLKLPPHLFDIKCDSDSSMEETVFVKEASDDDDDDDEETVGHFFEDEKILAIKRMYNVEYEIDTSSASDSDVTVTDTENEVEETLQTPFVSKDCKTSDEEFWADQSADECYVSDIEISESDHWLCKECGILNKPPMRCCLKCWEERRGWVDGSDKRVPPRHKRKNKNSTESADNLKNDTNAAIDTVQPGTSKELITPLLSSHSTKPQCSSSQTPHIKNAKVCILCCSSPMNATVVHGKIGHQFSCYKCARKLLSLNKRCPICRRHIERVIHQIVFD